MLFKRNVPGWERILRVVGGVALLIVSATVSMPTYLVFIIAASGVGSIVSAAAGWCPACAMVGRRLAE